MLIQVVADAGRFPHEEGDLLVGRTAELMQHADSLLELLRELLLLLVAPGFTEVIELSL